MSDLCSLYRRFLMNNRRNRKRPEEANRNLCIDKLIYAHLVEHPEWTVVRAREHIAEILGVSVAMIYKWQEKERRIQNDEIEKLARLGHDVGLSRAWGNDILKNDGNPHPNIPRVLHDVWGSQKIPLNNLDLPNYDKFFGRSKDLEKIHDRLLPHPHNATQLIAITGIGGVGKTAIAFEIAYHYLLEYENLPQEERFDAIIWFSAKETTLTETRIRSIRKRDVSHTLEDLHNL